MNELGEFSNQKLNSLFTHAENFHPKVYVSRAGLPTGSLLGEAWIESYMRAQGFFIMRPQELSITTQLDIYRKSEFIVFVEGSACHGVELLGKLPGRCVIINRRKNITPAIQTALESRFSLLDKYTGNVFAGSPLINKIDGHRMNNGGVTVANPVGLLQFIKDLPISPINGFDATVDLHDWKSYENQVMLDFEKYIKTIENLEQYEGRTAADNIKQLISKVLRRFKKRG